MRPVWFRTAALGLAALLLIAAYKRAEPSSVMADAANAFLNSLWPDQKAKVSYAFDDDERLSWHFVPTGANYKPGDRELRKGMPLRAMQPFQRELATALLAARLSQQGVIKAQSIMSLEQVLLILEGAKPVNRRDPDNYFITIFGTPSAKGTWAYRIEGHHLAQNYTIVDGKVSDSPSFFGSNPAEVRIGPRKGLRVLALEDDYGYDMIESLDTTQQNVAVVEQDCAERHHHWRLPQGCPQWRPERPLRCQDDRRAVRQADDHRRAIRFKRAAAYGGKAPGTGAEAAEGCHLLRLDRRS
jgi:hypothetical protein